MFAKIALVTNIFYLGISPLNKKINITVIFIDNHKDDY